MFMERRRFNQEGYSLMEVMIAIGIFSIGLLATMSLQTYSINTNAKSMGVTDACGWAADRMEKMVTLPYDDIVDTTETEGPYTIALTVAEGATITNVKTISVTVSSINNRPKNITFTYYKADN
jgi:type IV pilus assembly protein PilV